MSEETLPSNKLESRVQNVEQAIQLLTELALRADERMDSFEDALSNLMVKVEALADAQIRTEASVGSIAEAQTRIAEALAHLAEAGAHTDQRLDALIDIVRERNENR